MPLITARPRGTRWAIAVITPTTTTKLGDFATRADAMKAGQVVSQILGVEFTPWRRAYQLEPHLAKDKDKIMPDYSEHYGGRYYKSEDLLGKPFAGVVESAKLEKMNDGRMRVVVYFDCRKKGVVLNAKRHNFMVSQTGSKNTDDWIGLKVGVRAGTTDFGGKDVGCIEFVPPPNREREKAADENSRIPW
jgi:hypothetical protein